MTSDLNALLGSRICHDLISPLGAIGNGVELLQMSGLANSEELSLISESVANANARIRLFRVAFGAAAEDHMMASNEVLATLRPIAEQRRIDLNWQVKEDVDRATVRLAFLLYLCCETAMSRGGVLNVSRKRDGSWAMHVTGDRLRIDPATWVQLEDPVPKALSAAEVHFALASLAAAQLNRRIVTETSETSITIRF